MSTGSNSDWRDVIRAYLDAAWEDQRRRHSADLNGCEAMCLKEFASESVRREHQQLIQHRIEALESPPPESAYELVEESHERAIAQIIPPPFKMGRVSMPQLATRFVLENIESTWRITGIWHACNSCNPAAYRHTPSIPDGFVREVGRCFVCGGTGHARHPKVSGLWPFRRIRFEGRLCTACNGSGGCRHCGKSTLPGWTSAFTTDWFDFDPFAEINDAT